MWTRCGMDPAAIGEAVGEARRGPGGGRRGVGLGPMVLEAVRHRGRREGGVGTRCGPGGGRRGADVDPMTVEAIEERAGAQVVAKWYRHG
jgi:hypothetical protein